MNIGRKKDAPAKLNPTLLSARVSPHDCFQMSIMTDEFPCTTPRLKTKSKPSKKKKKKMFIVKSYTRENTRTIITHNQKSLRMEILEVRSERDQDSDGELVLLRLPLGGGSNGVLLYVIVRVTTWRTLTGLTVALRDPSM